MDRLNNVKMKKMVNFKLISINGVLDEYTDSLSREMINFNKIPYIVKMGKKFIIDITVPGFGAVLELIDWDDMEILDRVGGGLIGSDYSLFHSGLITISNTLDEGFSIDSLQLYFLDTGWGPLITNNNYADFEDITCNIGIDASNL